MRERERERDEREREGGRMDGCLYAYQGSYIIPDKERERERERDERERERGVWMYVYMHIQEPHNMYTLYHPRRSSN